MGRAQVRGGGQVLDVCLANPDRDEADDTGPLHGPPHPQGEGPADDRLDRPGGDRAGPQAVPGQVDRQLDQPRGRRGALRAGGAAPARVRSGGGGRLHRRGSAAGDGGEPGAQARHRRARPRAPHRQLRPRRPGTSSSTRSCSPSAPATANYVGSAVETIEGLRAIKARFPDSKTILGISNVSFGLPPAGREVLNAVFLYHCTKAGLDYAIVNTERLERYASIPDEDRRARRGPRLHARGRPGGRLRGPLPGPERGAAGGRGRAAARRAARSLHRRGLQGRPRRRPRPEAPGGGAARHHQRPPHEGHGGGGPAVQRQPADRGRGAPVGRGHEGGGGVPRALDGEGRERDPRQHRARHGQGRRPRHRQESRRDHPEEQRLPRDQPRDQGAARGADRGLSRAQARRLRPVRAAREVRSADGGHRPGPARGRHRGPALRGRGGADAQVHGDAHRAASTAGPPCTPAMRWTGSTWRTGSSGRPRARACSRRSAPIRRRSGAAAAEAAPTAGALRGGRGRPVLGVADGAGSGAVGPRPPRAAGRAAHPRLPVPEPPDAARQAPRAEGLRVAAPRRGRRQGARAARASPGPRAGGAPRGADPRPRPLPVLPRGQRRRRPRALRGRPRGRAVPLPAAAGRRAPLPGRLRARARPRASPTTSRCSR